MILRKSLFVHYKTLKYNNLLKINSCFYKLKEFKLQSQYEKIYAYMLLNTLYINRLDKSALNFIALNFNAFKCTYKPLLKC